jgi:anti-sigma-K factor RskA
LAVVSQEVTKRFSATSKEQPTSNACSTMTRSRAIWRRAVEAEVAALLSAHAGKLTDDRKTSPTF